MNTLFSNACLTDLPRKIYIKTLRAYTHYISRALKNTKN